MVVTQQEVRIFERIRARKKKIGRRLRRIPRRNPQAPAKDAPDRSNSIDHFVAFHFKEHQYHTIPSSCQVPYLHALIFIHWVRCLECF
jgi:hypothetical protein